MRIQQGHKKPCGRMPSKALIQSVTIKQCRGTGDISCSTHQVPMERRKLPCTCRLWGSSRVTVAASVSPAATSRPFSGLSRTATCIMATHDAHVPHTVMARLDWRAMRLTTDAPLAIGLLCDLSRRTCMGRVDLQMAVTLMLSCSLTPSAALLALPLALTPRETTPLLVGGTLCINPHFWVKH